MTPAINAAQKANVHYQVHQYEHDPDTASYGEEAVEKMGKNPEQVFKTLVVKLDGKQLAVAIIPVAKMLDLKAVASACKAKKATMAEPQEVQRSTGYVLGGVSPLGQKKQLLTVLDDSSEYYSSIFVSAGRRGLEIELLPADLLQMTGGYSAAIAR
ncbi:aminoacyl-tRNA deacylase [Endozoicomonas sp. (ex Bugula neritina AB1)]|nr:aminoacyl-tRNA deacylase [Endozoicomonas sp. (ex Bugula neritina AB1)]